MSDVIVAFDDFIHGSTTVYTSSFFNALLGELEAYSIQAVAEGMPGGATANVTIQLETSGDGRNWSSKNPTAEITTSVAAGATVTAFGSDINVRPGVALVRARIDVSSFLGPPGLKLVVYVRTKADPKFSPARIAGCNLWLRADQGIELVGSPSPVFVQSWKDRSSAGHDATQLTAARQPTYNATPINGMPTLFFDASIAGAERIMSLAGSIALGAGHVFLVGKSVSALPPVASRSGLWHLGGTPSPTLFPSSVDGMIYDDFGSNAQYACGPPVAPVTSPYCYEVQAISGSWQSMLNGVLQFSNPANTVAWSGTLELGGNLAGGVFFDGHLAEIALFDHVLGSGERDALVVYFNQRYALGMV